VDWASIAGVAIALAVLLLLVIVKGRFTTLSGDISRFTAQSSTVLILGWFIAAFGMAAASKAFLTLFPGDRSPALQIHAGALSVIMCGPILRIGKAFDDFIKTRS
jgi:hypothetical protein